MQSVRFVMRTIGLASGALGVVSADSASEDIEYGYLSQGYHIQSSHYLGDVKNGADVVGYKMMLILVKDEELVPSKVKAK